MKVSELIALLAKHDLDLEVWMSSDGEGNTYSKFYDVGERHYVHRSGDITSEEHVGGESNEKVLVLWPE